MSNKFTKSQLEKIIKEEVSKLINEETTSPLDKYGAGLKVNLDAQNMQFVVSGNAIQKVRDEFDSLLSALAPVIGKYRGIASKGKNSSGGIPGFDLLTTQILQKPETWMNMVKDFWMPGTRYSIDVIISKGPQRLVRVGIRALFNAVERADNQFDDLDPYDGFASGGLGRAKAGMDSDQRFAYLYMRNRMPNVSARHEYPDALVTTFINWLFDKVSGVSAAEPPAPAPVPDNTPFADQGPPMPDDITGPESTPSVGGSDGTCRQFNRLAVKITGLEVDLRACRWATPTLRKLASMEDVVLVPWARSRDFKRVIILKWMGLWAQRLGQCCLQVVLKRQLRTRKCL